MKKSKIFLNVKTYFSFSKSERNGVLFLTIILFLVILANIILPRIAILHEKNDFSSFQKSIDSLFVSDKVKVNSSYSEKFKHTLGEDGNKKSKPIHVLEINTADSASLVALPGIGTVLASRIIKYRRILGGFVHVNQLREVYGFQEGNIKIAFPHLFVDTQKASKINLDSASYPILAMHPYIGKIRAKQIMRLRYNPKNTPVNFELLFRNSIFDSIQWRKIKPYVTTE